MNSVLGRKLGLGVPHLCSFWGPVWGSSSYVGTALLLGRTECEGSALPREHISGLCLLVFYWSKQVPRSFPKLRCRENTLSLWWRNRTVLCQSLCIEVRVKNRANKPITHSKAGINGLSSACFIVCFHSHWSFSLQNSSRSTFKI